MAAAKGWGGGALRLRDAQGVGSLEQPTAKDTYEVVTVKHPAGPGSDWWECIGGPFAGSLLLADGDVATFIRHGGRYVRFGVRWEWEPRGTR